MEGRRREWSNLEQISNLARKRKSRQLQGGKLEVQASGTISNPLTITMTNKQVNNQTSRDNMTKQRKYNTRYLQINQR